MGSNTYIELGISRLILNIKKIAPTDIITDQSVEGNSSAENPSLQLTLVYVKLRRKLTSMNH